MNIRIHLIQKRSLACRILSTVLAVLVAAGCMIETAFAASTGHTNAKVVLRKSTSTSSKALQTLPAGEKVEILGSSGSWYKVSYGSFNGYILKKYVSAKSSSAASSSSASSQIKALGSAPGIMRVGDENSDVKKLQKALDILGYYDGEIDGKYGKGTTAAVKAYQKDKKLTADGYAGERTVKSIFGSVSSRSLTTQSNPGTTGSSSGASASSRIKALGSAPGIMRVGDSNSDVTKLQKALNILGYYKGSIDGKYGSGTKTAVKAYQKAKGLTADGYAGELTIKSIFGSVSSKSLTTQDAPNGGNTGYKTEVLDWYKDNVSRLIPKNARFTVKDCLTGKTFEMVRWSGGDHMDAEPANDDATSTIKSIYGGSFSWRRRAILVKYNGHVYAASMNGMPHGTDTISNDFDGHLCIHFKNSKTHGSDKIDPDHQNAIEKASKYSW
ncbi:MAG: peptidoglycan-binding protein [Clostridia bacterium]|nr:peptidoglycan-binding protein [Clostridia bacterium]